MLSLAQLRELYAYDINISGKRITSAQENGQNNEFASGAFNANMNAGAERAHTGDTSELPTNLGLSPRPVPRVPVRRPAPGGNPAVVPRTLLNPNHPFPTHISG